MQPVPIEYAEGHLAEILAKLVPGEAVEFTTQGQILAKLIKTECKSWPCQAGSAKGKILYIAPDFDEPFEEFKEYMD